LGDQKQTRLELYVDILKALGEKDVLNIKAIQGRTNIGPTDLSVAIKFLAQQNLIQLHNVGNRIEYQNTHRGIRVFKYLSQGTRSTDAPIAVNSNVGVLSLQRTFE
jgi:predicted transcriptional regulator